MRRSWASRATIVLLIASILVGGSGAPVLDAVVYHLGGARPGQLVTHLEPKGARHNHGDACTLGWLLRVQASASSAFVPAVIPVRLTVVAATMPPSAPRATTFFSPQPSRAPPARNA
jgi:hypothetical protein